MTRDEKIEALAMEIEAVWHTGNPPARPSISSRTAATIAQDRIDAAATNWTRVEDGLPTVSNHYLVTRRWAEGQTMVCETFFQLPGAWELSNILAWAPLPEPWRG